MVEALITVMPHGADLIYLRGRFVARETLGGWEASMLIAPDVELYAEHLIGEVADLAVGDRHYGVQVSEYHRTDRRIVVEGLGPMPW